MTKYGLAMRYGNTEMDRIRRQILELLSDSRSNLRLASLVIRRNTGYPRQFDNWDTPRVLAEHDREATAGHLGCSRGVLKPKRRPRGDADPKLAPRNPGCRSTRFDNGQQRGAGDQRPRGGGPRGSIALVIVVLCGYLRSSPLAARWLASEALAEIAS